MNDTQVLLVLDAQSEIRELIAGLMREKAEAIKGYDALLGAIHASRRDLQRAIELEGVNSRRVGRLPDSARIDRDLVDGSLVHIAGRTQALQEVLERVDALLNNAEARKTR